MEDSSSKASSVLVDPGGPTVVKQAEGHFVELVRLLVKKAVLTEHEASDILKAPSDE